MQESIKNHDRKTDFKYNSKTYFIMAKLMPIAVIVILIISIFSVFALNDVNQKLDTVSNKVDAVSNNNQFIDNVHKIKQSVIFIPNGQYGGALGLRQGVQKLNTNLDDITNPDSKFLAQLIVNSHNNLANAIESNSQTGIGEGIQIDDSILDLLPSE